MPYPYSQLDRRALIVLAALLESGAQADKPLRINVAELSDRAQLPPIDLFYGLGQLLLTGCLTYAFDDETFQTVTVNLNGQVNDLPVNKPAPPALDPAPRNVRNVNANVNNIYINNATLRTETKTEPLRTRPRIVPEGEVVKLDLPETDNGPSPVSKPQPPELTQDLARHLATALGESDRLAYYRSLVRRYPAYSINRALQDCLAFPASAIRKNRAALFKHLLNRYAQNSTPPSDA